MFIKKQFMDAITSQVLELLNAQKSDRIVFSDIEKKIPSNLQTSLFKYLDLLHDEKIVRIRDQYLINTSFPPFPSKAFENVIGRGIKYSQTTNIATTNNCHGKCSYCNYPAKGTIDLPKEEYFKIISQLQDFNIPVLGFTGGESLLRDDLEQIIEYVDDRSSTILFTSGLGLTKDKAKKLRDAGLFSLSISLDHHDKKTNDAIRFPGSYDTAINAINNAREAGFYTVTSVVVTDKTIDNLEDYIRFVNGLGIHGVRVLDRVPSGECIKELSVSQETNKRLIEIHKTVNANLNLPQLTTFAHTEGREMYGCGAGGIHHMYVDGQGHLRACDFVPITFGNLTKESLIVAYKKMRKTFQQPRERCFMKKYHVEISKLLDDKIVVHIDEIAPKLQELKTSPLPKLYR